MPKKVSPVPKGVRALATYLSVSNGNAAIEFYRKAFGAKVVSKMVAPDGQGLLHAHLKVGDCDLMLADVNLSQNSLGRSCGLFLYVPAVDTTFKKAVALGAKVIAPVGDMFWGDRWAQIEDPFGQVWQIATHVEDVSPRELRKRMLEMPKQPPPPTAPM